MTSLDGKDITLDVVVKSAFTIFAMLHFIPSKTATVADSHVTNGTEPEALAGFEPVHQVVQDRTTEQS